MCVTNPGTFSEVRDQLLAEHAGLRRLMALCEGEAKLILSGECSDRQLLTRVLQLVDAVESHNLHEEEALRPLLLDSDSFGPVRVEQMMEDHVTEHDWLRQSLREAAELEVPDRSARAVLAAMQLIREHMDEEEAQFLNDRVLRDDIVAIDAAGD
jgi:hypothetical protein